MISRIRNKYLRRLTLVVATPFVFLIAGACFALSGALRSVRDGFDGVGGDIAHCWRGRD
ncbi:hypothetical protein [Labrys neptuniae]